MVVRTIKARRDRKTGDIAVTFTVSPETWRSMSRAADEGWFLGTADYIAAEINTRLIEHESARSRVNQYTSRKK